MSNPGKTPTAQTSNSATGMPYVVPDSVRLALLACSQRIATGVDLEVYFSGSWALETHKDWRLLDDISSTPATEQEVWELVEKVCEWYCRNLLFIDQIDLREEDIDSMDDSQLSEYVADDTLKTPAEKRDNIREELQNLAAFHIQMKDARSTIETAWRALNPEKIEELNTSEKWQRHFQDRLGDF